MQTPCNSAKVQKKYPKSIRIVNAWLVTLYRREKRSVLLLTSVVPTGGTRTFRADRMGTGRGEFRVSRAINLELASA
jgi:hypothetical protein